MTRHLHLVTRAEHRKTRSPVATLKRLSQLNDRAKVYEFLYSLDLKHLIQLLKTTGIEVYTSERLKDLIIKDAREKLYRYGKTLETTTLYRLDFEENQQTRRVWLSQARAVDALHQALSQAGLKPRLTTVQRNIDSPC